MSGVGESDQSQAQSHKCRGDAGMRCCVVNTKDAPLLHLRDGRSPGAAMPPPNLPRQALFLPSLPHYLLPLTSAPGLRAEGREDGDGLGAVGVRIPAAPGEGRL